MDMATYWPRVVWRALVDALKFFGGWKILFPPMFFAAGVFVHVYRVGWEKSLEEIEVAASFGLGAFLIIFLILFVVNFVLTPPRFEAEAALVAKQDSQTLHKRINGLELQIHDREKRQKAISRLWELRVEGVEIRNRAVSLAAYNGWHDDYEAWELKVFSEAGKISPNFQKWLQTLDRVRPPPRLRSPPCGPQHHTDRKNISEVLLRIQEFLETDMLDRDIRRAGD